MTAPWFRVDAAYLTDGRLVRAGWQAGLLWVPVLALLKQREGALRDDDLDPAVLSRLTGAPFDVVEAGVAGLRSAGMLVRGQRTVAGGAGGRRTIDGWTVESWDRYQPDGRAPWPERKAAFGTASQGDGTASQGGAVASRETGGVSRETRMTGQDRTGLDGTKTGRDVLEQQQQRPREGTVRYGPDPTTGDVELAARTLFARMQRQEAGRPPKHPSAVDLERLALILTGPDAARAADVERACGAAGMGFRAFLLCWDDDGALVPDRIPSRKAPGERPEPEWAVRRRRLAEALERRREIYADIDAAGGETVTPEQEAELNEISRLERLGA